MMEQEVRNKLRNVVTKCRKLLEESIGAQLQGQFGIHASGKIEPEVDLVKTGLAEEDVQYRRDILDHFEHIKALGYKPKDALAQLIREIAFTHLNRFCAYKMMAARDVIIGGKKFRDPIGSGRKTGTNSNAFMFYLADHPDDEKLAKSGQRDRAYRHFLDWIGSQLSEEIGVLFNPNDPANRLYPPQRVLNEIFDLLNGAGIKEEETVLRESWSQIWSEDETIGWVYQYFTPKELIKTAREAGAPQNSYELAFRNQFFTPRYVVRYLTDNTLGRLWYEMRQGRTRLADECEFMVNHPNELFLGIEDPPPGTLADCDSSEHFQANQPVCTKFRVKKDPREIQILDPACGSGHFLLYCFDLLLTVYEEAYDDAELKLRDDYPDRLEFARSVPGLILEKNLHGIDIDLRASQIAGFALWLRCQKRFRELKLDDRPKIVRSNLICAEEISGEPEIADQFKDQLRPRLIGQLVDVVFESMRNVSTLGFLADIEGQLREAISTAKKQWSDAPRETQLLLFQTESNSERQTEFPFDVSGVTDEEFWHTVEPRVLDALANYVAKATAKEHLKRSLFAQDAARGFALVELVSKQFDVVLMNPPFGEALELSEGFLGTRYPTWNRNLLCAFIERAWEKTAADGTVGVIFDRTAAVKSSYEPFRRRMLLEDNRITGMLDLGWGVLDANVEVTSIVAHHRHGDAGQFIDVRKVEVFEKENSAISRIAEFKSGRAFEICKSPIDFTCLPNAVIGYDLPTHLLRAVGNKLSLASSGYRAFTGHQFRTEQHFRIWWETENRTSSGINDDLFNGSGFSPYTTSIRNRLVTPCSLDQMPNSSTTNLRNRDKHLRAGLCFGKRSEYFSAHVFPAGCYFSLEGLAIPCEDEAVALDMLATLNTPLARSAINRFCGQHKTSGYVNLFPYRSLAARFPEIVEETRVQVLQQNALRQYDETQLFYSIAPHGSRPSDFASRLAVLASSALQSSVAHEAKCDSYMRELYGVTEADSRELDALRDNQPDRVPPIEDIDLGSGCCWFTAHSSVSHALGRVFGRWDNQHSTADPVECIDDPFASLPDCPPLYTNPVDQQGSRTGDLLVIDEDGILVEDATHEDDIVNRVEAALSGSWDCSLAELEADIASGLCVSSLRDYFSRPGNKGFWKDHIKRYTKNGRKAPIYWLLQSSRKNYSVWIYYPRYDADTKFKIIKNYVDPRLVLIDEAIAKSRDEITEANELGKGVKVIRDIERLLESQLGFLEELNEFRESLHQVAALALTPSWSDGVLLNIAPLHELVPWNEAKKAWDKLIDGKFAWSSMSKQLREKGLVKD